MFLKCSFILFNSDTNYLHYVDIIIRCNLWLWRFIKSISNSMCFDEVSNTPPSGHLHFYTLDAGQCCCLCRCNGGSCWCCSAEPLDRTHTYTYTHKTIQEKKKALLLTRPTQRETQRIPRAPTRPFSAAIISAVRPNWSTASTGASWERSSWTQSTWPEKAAAWRGVLKDERGRAHWNSIQINPGPTKTFLLRVLIKKKSTALSELEDKNMRVHTRTHARTCP